MSKYSELVERINARPNDAPLPAEYLLDEAAETIAKLEAEKAELVDRLENLVIGIGMGWDLDGLVEAARATLAKLEAGQ